MNKVLANIIVAKFEKGASEELQKLAAIDPHILSAIESISRGERLPMSMLGAGAGAGAGAIYDEDSALKGALIGGGIGGATPLAWKGARAAMLKPGMKDIVGKGGAGTHLGGGKFGTKAPMSDINDLVASLGLKAEDQAELVKALGAAGTSQAPAEAITRGVQYGALGAAGGAVTGENGKDRLRRALIGGSMGAGAGAGSAAGRLVGRNAPKGTELATRLAGTVGGGVGGYAAGKSMVGKKKKK
jgi:hypothetical protein